MVSDPIEKLDLKAAYSYYDYDNETPAMVFKSVPTLNDVASTWSATAYPFAFSTQKIEGTESYNITEQIAARFVASIETDHNKGLMVLQQDTTTFGPVLDWNPYDWLGFRTSYQHAYRDSPGYDNNRTSLVNENAETTELGDLRRFDEATVKVIRPASPLRQPRARTDSLRAIRLRRLQLSVL